MKQLMFGLMASALALSAAYAGSCADCDTTYKEHAKACSGDQACLDRAREAYQRCKIGCAKN